MKINTMKRILNVVWEYLESVKGSGLFSARWAFPLAFIFAIIPLGMVRHLIRGIGTGDFAYAVLVATTIAMLWGTAMLLLSMHFKFKGILEECEKERAIDNLEKRMISHNLSDGKGMILFTPGEERLGKFFIVGRDEYMRDQ